MKIVVVSDSHGNIANLKHVLGFAKEIEVGAIIHCGDWDNLQAVEVVLASRIPVYGVLGNADIEPGINEKLKMKSTKFGKSFLQFEIDGRKIGAVHQLTFNHQQSTISLEILFYGHTHRQEELVVDGSRVVNPGALVKEICFAVYDTETNKVDLVTI